MTVSRLFAKLMESRGVGEDFLHPKYDAKWVHDPFGLPDMEKAVERLLRAREAGEKVLVFGDYDADGVTAATVMKDGLNALGIEVAEVMLPDRFVDGYGMSQKVVERAREAGATLVVTVDCGSSNEEIIAELKAGGVDTIVTDHHECPVLPKSAVAVVNPKRPRSKYEFRELAGVGVAYKVICALAMRVKDTDLARGWEKWLLDLVAVGTVCDSMPLLGENRALVYWGMQVLQKGKRVGLRELMRTAGVKAVSSEAIGFMVGPRLNAAGRLKDPYDAYALLNASTRVEAAALAVELNGLNAARKTAQEEAVTEARELVSADARVIVVRGKWSEGLIGIVAGKLVEEFARPVFVLTGEEGGLLRGSARGYGDFDLAAAIDHCRELLEGGGGHKMAAGVSLQEGKLKKFERAVNEFYDGLGLGDQKRYAEVAADLEIENVGDLSNKFFAETRLLEPFGEGNPEPTFRLPGVIATEVRKMGRDNKHLAMTVLGRDGKSLRLVAFSAPEEWCVERGNRVDVAVRLMANEWRGVSRLEGQIMALKEIVA